MERRKVLLALWGGVIAVSGAGCVAGPSLPEGRTAWFALGTEPGWTVELTPGRLLFVGDYGETRLVVSRPRVERRANITRVSGQGLAMTIERLASCSDGMSDRMFADTVTVEVGGRTLRGCGGAVMRASPG